MSLRLNYAVAASTLALIVSGAGVSWAAASLPRHSVGTKQLQNGAVTSAKIADGSVRSGDLARGTIPAPVAGPTGPRGPQGPAGPPGEEQCDDLLCASAELPPGWHVELDEDGWVAGRFRAYDAHCSDTSGLPRCTVRIAAPGLPSDQLQDWLRNFRLTPGSDLVLRLRDPDDEPTRALVLINARSAAQAYDADRFQWSFTADALDLLPAQ